MDSCIYSMEDYDNAWEKVRLRNVKIAIAKSIINSDEHQKDSFAKQELKDMFCLKEWDIKHFTGYLFEMNEDKYTFSNDFKAFLEKVYESYDLVQEEYEATRTEFIGLYSGIYNEEKHTNYTSFSNGVYNRIKKRIEPLIPVLHWGTLPLFNKYLLYNRNIDPEIDTVAFYNHPDCLNALMDELRGEGIILSNQGDKNLNKQMTFRVYTRRWGHDDTYMIERTVDGWDCAHIAINGSCDMEGSPYLYENLDHDSVFYPADGVKYAMQRLWESADEGDIDFEEMSVRLQQIGDWISNVEKAVGTQPEWVGYY